MKPQATKNTHVTWPTTRREFLAQAGGGFGGLAPWWHGTTLALKCLRLIP